MNTIGIFAPVNRPGTPCVRCSRAINSAGLDAHIGFLHEICVGKNSLAYDLQEPFRFLIDLAVLTLVETNAMNKRDFIRTNLS